MATLTDKELQEIYELQKKLFTTSTENNPYLKNNPVNPDLSKGLNTDSKTIIGAINDIFAITTAVKDTNADFIDRFNRIIGNEELNPTLVKKLSEIGTNFYDVLFKTWEKAENNADRTELFETKLEEFKTHIEEVIEESTEDAYSYEDKCYTGNTFTISCNPISPESAAIYINGVHYDNDCFNLSNDNKTFTWVADDFEIVNSYKLATEFDCLKTYYTKVEDSYSVYEGVLDRNTFNNGDFYEVDEELSDKVIVRYTSYGITNKAYYRTLYDISLLNTVSKSIGKNPYNNNVLTDTYDWSNISSILNKNLLGKFEYTNDGKVRITLDSRDSSIFSVVSAKNWDTKGTAAKTFVGNSSDVTNFDEFCNLAYGTTTNTRKWVAFFAFEIGSGNYANIYMISSETDPIALADRPASGSWYYGWDDEQVGNEKALTMSNSSFNPYIDLTRIFSKLQEAYEN